MLGAWLFHVLNGSDPFRAQARAPLVPGPAMRAQRRAQRSAVLAAAAAPEVTAAPTLPFRVGHGWDLHRLEPGYPLIIGGIDIPHDRGCVAHSDGAW